MLKIRLIDHVVMRTTRLDDMLQFYVEVLGCSLEKRQDDLGLVQLRAGDSLIDLVTVDSELGKLGGGPPVQDGRNVDHFCLQLEAGDQQQLLDYLQSRNIETGEFAERYGAEGYGPSIYINDPEGNVVELKLPPERS